MCLFHLYKALRTRYVEIYVNEYAGNSYFNYYLIYIIALHHTTPHTARGTRHSLVTNTQEVTPLGKEAKYNIKILFIYCLLYAIYLRIVKVRSLGFEPTKYRQHTRSSKHAIYR